MKVEELELSENDKKGFLVMEVPSSIAKIAWEMKRGYDTAYKKLQIWLEQGLIKRQKIGRKYKYFINQDIIKL